MGLFNRLRRGWNAFMNKDPTWWSREQGAAYSRRQDRVHLTGGNERSIATSIYSSIALDVSLIDVCHCLLDENNRFRKTVDSGLNDCLTLAANKDQTARAFIQDCVMSMLDEGVVAIVPIDTDADPNTSDSFGIFSMRTGKILDWYPDSVKIRVYNDRTGEKEDIVMLKRAVCIVENPLYAVINEPNSNMQRLIKKLRLLDVTDERTASGKMDLIIQMPYSTRAPIKQAQAEKRRTEIENQLTNSQYGVAYIDSSEKVIQLNRSVENNLLKHIEYLTDMVFSQIGMTQSILNGSADEQTMLNYNNRIIEPIVSAITGEMRRKFLSEDARKERQTVMFFRDPFRLVPVNQIAEIADKFTRNEIMTSNEIRQVIGMKPSTDPKADLLQNSNIAQPARGKADAVAEKQDEKEDKNQNGKNRLRL